MKKTIILIIPHHFNIYEAFVKNIENLDYNIEMLFKSDNQFRYKNNLQRVKNFILKLFGNDSYKKKLRSKFDDNLLEAAILKIKNKVDFALVIRPDYFSQETLSKLKKKTNRLVAYQWDGLDRYPKAKEIIPIFDCFFLFDIFDYRNYKSIFPNIHHINNFYFDFDSDSDIKENIHTNDVKEIFFIGSFIENRKLEIFSLYKIFNNLKLKINVNLLYFDKTTVLNYQKDLKGINFINKPLTYLEVIEMVKKTDIILDFVDSVHNGLSFRIFEALFYSKKLITTNKLIANYDFYYPNNILIWDQSMREEEIKEFLSTNYIKIDDTIKAKYSFTNWLKTVLKD